MIYLVQIIGETRHGRHIIRQLMSCFQLEGREKVNLAAAEMCPAGQLGSDKSTIKWFIVAGGEAVVKLPGGLSQTNHGEESSEVAVPSLLMVQAIHVAIQRYRNSKRMGIIKGEFQRKIIFCKVGKNIRHDFFEEKNRDGGGRRGHCKLQFSLHMEALSGPAGVGIWCYQEGRVKAEHLQRESSFISFCFHHVIFDFGVYIKEIFWKIQPVPSQVVN